MDARLTTLLSRALAPDSAVPGLPLFHAGRWLADDADAVARVTAAFLIVASGESHPDHARARELLDAPPAAAADMAAFYREALDRIEQELSDAFDDDPR